jgi:diguanylate cyclase
MSGGKQMQSTLPNACRSTLHESIVDALAGDPTAAGFEVHYQPIVRLADASTVAVEALARWNHPVLGRIAPTAFVSSAEYAGLMGILDDFVLNQACADASALADVYGHEINLHVNVSASRLGRPDLAAAVVWALERHQLPPRRLTLEITETSRIDDLDAAAVVLQRIRDLDVRLALDDFGSGFNAFRRLHALPVDLIKLADNLTRADAEPWRSEALCRSVLTICDQMNLTVIAEGIETPAQAFTLLQMGCSLGQGYLYGMPSSVARVVTLHSGSHYSATKSGGRK